MVQRKVDIVITVLKDDEYNDEGLKQVLRHCGMDMKERSVSYIVCNFIQFSKIYSVVCAEGMEVIKHPMIYIQDSPTIKKRTL